MKLIQIFIATAVLTMTCLNAQDRTVSVNGPRSLMAALMEIQRISNIPISFEEPPYENPADVVKTTPASHPGLRPMLIARTSLNPVVVSLLGLNSTLDPIIFVGAVLDAYHKAGLPGRYKTVRRQRGIDVVPIEVAGFSSSRKEVTPIMSRSLSFPYAERSGVETFQLIAEEMSKAAGRKIRLLHNPYSTGSSTRVSLSSEGSSIADSLASLAAKIGIPDISYVLAYDPNDDSFYLTVMGISPSHPSGTGKRELTTTGTDNPFFVKPKP